MPSEDAALTPELEREIRRAAAEWGEPGWTRTAVRALLAALDEARDEAKKWTGLVTGARFEAGMFEQQRDQARAEAQRLRAQRQAAAPAPPPASPDCEGIS